MLGIGRDFYLTSFEVLASQNSHSPLFSFCTIWSPYLLLDLASLHTNLSSDDTLLEDSLDFLYDKSFTVKE